MKLARKVEGDSLYGWTWVRGRVEKEASGFFFISLLILFDFLNDTYECVCVCVFL